MKKLLALSAVGLVLGLDFAAAEVPQPATSQKAACGNDQKDKAGKCPPAVVLPGNGALPVGAATNFAFIAPIVGGTLAAGAILGGGGKSPASTVSTTN